MRRTTLAVAGAALTLAVVPVSTSSAFASSGGSGASATVHPGRVPLGGSFTLVVDCTAFADPMPTKAEGQGLSEPITLHAVEGHKGWFAGEGEVSRDLGGEDSVGISGNCLKGGEDGSAFMATVKVGPSGSVPAGVGGSVLGANAGEVAGGAVLVAGAGFLAVRRRKAGRL
ncbi:hypothetical protein [Streptacidiphilus rugosus]|uniref:hypothetical protein n=1 Tax=Streptacidiphilus rugosus TaxID=405783 RepID=UPI00056978A1|nr:hypothetical protein [Streptacidiphilus rugosus]